MGHQANVNRAVVAISLVVVEGRVRPTIARRTGTDVNETPVFVEPVLHIVVCIACDYLGIEPVTLPDRVDRDSLGLVSVVTGFVGQGMPGVVQRKRVVAVVDVDVQSRQTN